jgi:hypothetical protein
MTWAALMRLQATVIDAWYCDSSTTYTTLNFLRPLTFSGSTRRFSELEDLHNGVQSFAAILTLTKPPARFGRDASDRFFTPTPHAAGATPPEARRGRFAGAGTHVKNPPPPVLI